MRKMILLVSFLLLTGAWALAQYGERHDDAQQQGNRVTLEGCLYGGDGYFAFTDGRGNTFELRGERAKLEGSIGRRVRISGRTQFDEDNPQAMSSNMEEVPTLHVFGVRQLSRRGCGQ